MQPVRYPLAVENPPSGKKETGRPGSPRVPVESHEIVRVPYLLAGLEDGELE